MIANIAKRSSHLRQFLAPDPASLPGLRVFACSMLMAALAIGGSALGGVSPALAFSLGNGSSNATDWIDEGQSRIRLIHAGARTDGTELLAIELEMDAGWKTYWRHSGETGIPPRFDWSASQNLGAFKTHWPAPKRFLDAGYEAIGYADRLVLPVTVERSGTGSAHVKLTLDYAVCEAICLPLHAEFALTLGERSDFRLRRVIEDAMSTVPEKLEPGSQRAVTVDTVEKGGKPVMLLDVPVADANRGSIDLFVEAPGVYLPVPDRVDEDNGGSPDYVRFAVPLSADSKAIGEDWRVTVLHPDGPYTHTLATPRP